MKIFKKKSIKQNKPSSKWKITKDCLNLIFECAKDSYPKEFGGLLRVDEYQKDTIAELIVLPGTISGNSHALFRMHMRPIDFTIVGTVHSHPSKSFYPSDADLSLFNKYGKIHIIAATPYTYSSWRAYNSQGQTLDVKIV